MRAENEKKNLEVFSEKIFKMFALFLILLLHKYNLNESNLVK